MTWNQFNSFENLYLAWKKARKGKSQTLAAQFYEQQLEEHLIELELRLKNGSFEFSPYRQFTLYEPVKRLVCAAPFADRIVHHALMNLLEPLMNTCMIPNSFACRRGKGVHLALHVLQRKLKKSEWILKLDLRKYFFTIDQIILLDQLKKDFQLPIKIITLIEQLLLSYESGLNYYFPQVGDDLFTVSKSRGLPIGNLTSQWLANYYLNGLDHAITGDSHCQGYLRYMDDMIVLCESKKAAFEIKERIIEWLNPLKLTLNKSKTQVFPTNNGVPFLGHHVWADRRRILRPNLKRFRNRMKSKSKAYSNDLITREELAASINGWAGFIQQPGFNISNCVLSKILFFPKNQVPYTYFLNNNKGWGELW